MKMKRGLAMMLGAIIGAVLLLLDTIFQIMILESIGFKYSITIIVGVVIGIILIVLTDNAQFEDMIGIRNIDILPDVCRWISYSLFAFSFVLLANDLAPTIARMTGLPVDTMFVATSAFLGGLVAVLKEAIIGRA